MPRELTGVARGVPAALPHDGAHLMVVGDEEEVERESGSNDDGSTTFCLILDDGSLRPTFCHCVVGSLRHGNPYYEPMVYPPTDPR